jgi:hypothetical protein
MQVDYVCHDALPYADTSGERRHQVLRGQGGHCDGVA